MPSYEQLDDEAAWRAEIAAPALATLASRIRGHWPGAEVGVKGNNVHLRGYHRSRRWIKESSYCTNRTYSVSRTAGDRSGGDPNWLCALDFGGISQAELHAVCKRLDAAVRAGLLEKITEWYGNFGDDGRVDGWDNISDRLASSDSSHLYHLHMSFDRGRANEDHSDVLAILMGEDMSWEEIHSYPERGITNPNGYKMGEIQLGTNDAVWKVVGKNDTIISKVDKLSADVAALTALVKGIVDGGLEVAATVGLTDEALEQVEGRVREVQTDALEGGAAAVRADA